MPNNGANASSVGEIFIPHLQSHLFALSDKIDGTNKSMWGAVIERNRDRDISESDHRQVTPVMAANMENQTIAQAIPVQGECLVITQDTHIETVTTQEKEPVKKCKKVRRRKSIKTKAA